MHLSYARLDIVYVKRVRAPFGDVIAHCSHNDKANFLHDKSTQLTNVKVHMQAKIAWAAIKTLLSSSGNRLNLSRALPCLHDID